MPINTSQDKQSDSLLKQSTLEPVVTGNKMYDNLYAANPYNDLTYHLTGWQALMNSLGFRTDYDRWLEDQQVNANEYNAQVASIKQQNDFNSPEAQASRMREAGMNPDLLGTQGVSDSASPVQDVNGMSPTTGDSSISVALPVISSFVGAVSKSLSQGLAFASDLLAFQGVQRDLDSKNLDNLSKVSEAVDRYLQDMISAGDVVDPESIQGRKNFLSHSLNSSKPFKKSVAKELGIPRRYRRAFERFVQDRSQSIVFENDIWQNAIKRNQLRSESAEQRFSKRYSEDDKVLDAYVGPIVEMKDQIYEQTVKNDKYRANLNERSMDVEAGQLDYEEQYYDELGHMDAGKAKASAETSEYWDRYYKSQINKIVHNAGLKITENLQKEADRGSGFAKGCLMSWALSEMLNFSVGDALDFAGSLLNPIGKFAGRGLKSLLK